MSNPRLVMIEWEDSAQPVPRWVWVDSEDFREWGTVLCKSVGWLVDENPRRFLLAPNIGEAEGGSLQASGIIRIPRRAVRSIDTLRRG